jgi:glutathione S-transferase
MKGSVMELERRGWVIAAGLGPTGSPGGVLLEAGLPFTAIKIDEHTKVIEGGGDYRKVNPLGYVPSLVLYDGTLLTEGPAIVQYIADKVPAKRLAPPNGTVERTNAPGMAVFLLERDAQGCFWATLL